MQISPLFQYHFCVLLQSEVTLADLYVIKSLCLSSYFSVKELAVQTSVTSPHLRAAPGPVRGKVCHAAEDSGILEFPSAGGYFSSHTPFGVLTSGNGDSTASPGEGR